MFVSKRRFILKTCGTTLLLQALMPLLELAREYCGFDAIEVSVTPTHDLNVSSNQELPTVYKPCYAARHFVRLM